MTKAIKKAKAIKLLILDVDAVLTDGSLYYSANGIELKSFHVHDGLGLKLLQLAGIDIAIISAKKSPLVHARLTDLGIDKIYQGYHDKLKPYQEIKNNLKLSDQEIAYAGDDLPDLPVLRKVGFAVTVMNSPIIDFHNFDLISKIPAGAGAVREICEYILRAQEKYETVVQSYLDKIS